MRQHHIFFIAFTLSITPTLAISEPTFFIFPLQKVSETFQFSPSSASRPAAINNQGQSALVVDAANDDIPDWRFIHYDPIFGQLTNNALNDNALSTANDINASGDIAGSIDLPGEPKPALVSAATLVEIPLIPDFTGGDTLGLNDSGLAVGYLSDSDQNYSAFRFDGSEITLLNGGHAIAYDINNAALIVGSATTAVGASQAFVWNQGIPFEIGAQLGADSSTATAVNDTGVIIGTFNAGGIEHGFIRHADALTITDLNSATTAGMARPLALNNRGDIVGTLERETSNTTGFAYVNERLIDLNDFLPGDSPWSILEAAAINDQGDIIAITQINGTRYASQLVPSTLRIDALAEVPGATNTRVEEHLGWSVAMSGTTLAASTTINDVKLYQFGDDNNWALQQTISSDTDDFGRTVALENNVLAIGDPLNTNDNGVEAGAVHLYRHDGETWTLDHTLTASDGVEGMHFGQTLAINGDTLIVGAPAMPAADGLGAAYVFTLIDGIWHEQRLAASQLDDTSEFGLAVALSDTSAAVTSQSGVHVYSHSAGLWQEHQVLTLTAWWSSNFGAALSIDNTRLAVGAPLDEQPGFGNANHGAVYIYELDAAEWVLQQRIFINNHIATGFGTSFGKGLALSEDLLIVGASRGGYPMDLPPADPIPNTWTGAVHIFAHNGERWIPQAELWSDDSANTDNEGELGQSLAFSDGIVAAGAIWHQHEPGLSSGGIYSWRIDGVMTNPFQEVNLDLEIEPLPAENIVGDDIPIVLAITNLSPDTTAPSTQLALTLPSGVTPTNMPAQCGANATPIRCDLGNIDANQNMTLAFTVTTADAGIFGLNFNIESMAIDPAVDNNNAHVDLAAFPNAEPLLNLDPPDTWQRESIQDGQLITATGSIQNWLVDGSQRTVSWYVDEQEVGTSTSETHQFNLGFVPNGEHTLTLRLNHSDGEFSGYGTAAETFTVQSGVPAVSFLNLQHNDALTLIPGRPAIIELQTDNWPLDVDGNGLSWSLNDGPATIIHTHQLDIEPALADTQLTNDATHTLSVTLVNNDATPFRYTDGDIAEQHVEFTITLPTVAIDTKRLVEEIVAGSSLLVEVNKADWPYDIKWSIENTEYSGITSGVINTPTDDLTPGTYKLIVELVDENEAATGIQDSKTFEVVEDPDITTIRPPETISGGGGTTSPLLLILAGMLILFRKGRHTPTNSIQTPRPMNKSSPYRRRNHNYASHRAGKNVLGGI